MKTYKDYIVEANMNGLNYMVKLTENSRPQVLSGTPLSVENVINHSSKVVRQSGNIHDYNSLFKNIIFKNCSDSPKDMLNALNKWSEYPDPVLLGKTWKFVRETKDFQMETNGRMWKLSGINAKKSIIDVSKAYTFQPEGTYGTNYLHIYFIRGIKPILQDK